MPMQKNKPTSDEEVGSQEPDAHEYLAESSLVLLQTTFDEALEEGLRDPVVFLVDCEDAIGQELAVAWLGNEVVQNAIADRQLEEDTENTATTVFARAIDWKTCQREIPPVFPYLAEIFQAPPPSEGVFVITVTEGGAAAMTVLLNE